VDVEDVQLDEEEEEEDDPSKSTGIVDLVLKQVESEQKIDQQEDEEEIKQEEDQNVDKKDQKPKKKLQIPHEIYQKATQMISWFCLRCCKYYHFYQIGTYLKIKKKRKMELVGERSLTGASQK